MARDRGTLSADRTAACDPQRETPVPCSFNRSLPGSVQRTPIKGTRARSWYSTLRGRQKGDRSDATSLRRAHGPLLTRARRPFALDRRGRVGRLLLLAVTIWVVASGCGPDASRDESATVERGQELYERSCASCHGGATGGSISDIPPPHNAEGHTWHHGDCVLADIIRDDSPPRPGAPDDFPTMPAFDDELDDDDIDAILAFIETWWTEEQREFQDERTEADCTEG